MGFFELYAEKLDYRTIGISIRGGGFAFQKDDESLGKDHTKGERKLCIESPLHPLEDLSVQAFRFNVVRSAFKLAIHLLKYRLPHSKSVVQLICPDAKNLIK